MSKETKILAVLGVLVLSGSAWAVVNDPISYWRFDEGGGTIAYDSAGGNHGTIYGAVWSAGQINGALSFDGVDDYVDCGNDSSLAITNNLTVAAWVKRTSAAGSSNEIIVSKYNGSRHSYRLLLLGNDRVRWWLSQDGTSGNRAYLDSTITITDTNWHFIAATFESGTLKIHIDGVERGSKIGSISSIKATQQPLFIGQEYSSGYFGGLIDDVRIYNRALTPEEIEQLYKGELSRRAFNPSPTDGAIHVDPNMVLSWSPGYGAASHDVYFGIDYNDVKNANTNSAEYIGNQGANSYEPSGLEYKTTYYWRVDEVNEPNVWKGDVWRFTTWANVISWWKFDEDSGTIATDSVGDNHGIVYGANRTIGPIDGALSFDGVDDYVDCGNDNSLATTNNLTLAGWVKRTGEGSSKEVIVSKYDGGQYSYRLFFLGNDRVRWYLLSDGGTSEVAYVDSTITITDATWHFIVATFESGTMKIYIDGAMRASKTASFSSINVTQESLFIGQENSSNYFRGMIDDVRIYGRALSASEIQQLYLDGLPDLQVEPLENFVSSGDEGGEPVPFEPSSKNYTLTNIGPTLLEWRVEATCLWLDIDPNRGTLLPGDTNTVIVSINARANDLDPGIYTCQIIFRDVISGFEQRSGAVLTVNHVPGEVEVSDSIPPINDLNMPFGDVIVGLSQTERVTITNTDPNPKHELIVTAISSLQFEGFYDEFPSTTLNPENWTNTGGVPTVDDVGLGEPSPPYSLRLNGNPSGGDAVESRIIDMSQLKELELKYWYQRTGGGEDPDSGEDLVIEYWNSSNWVELSRHPGDGPDMTWYEEVVVPLPSGAYHAGFRLRISSTGTSGDYDDWFVDDVSIAMMGVLSVPVTEVFYIENVPNLPAVIPPLGSIDINVVFEPTALKGYEDWLVIESEDMDEPEVEVQLSGMGALDYLEVIPDVNSVSVFSGHPGGPFIPTNTFYQLTNIGPNDIDWTAEPNVPWLNIWPSSGTLKPGESTTVTVTPNSQADTMPEGVHDDWVIFHNVTTGLKHMRKISLNVYTTSKMWAKPYSFDVNVPQRGTRTQVLTIGNTGDSALEFTLWSSMTDFIPLAAPEAGGDPASATSEIVISAPSGHDFTVAADAPFAPGELLVRFAPQANQTWPDTVGKNAILSSLGGAYTEREYKIAPGLCLVKLPDSMTIAEALVSFNNTSGILYAEPNYRIKLLSDCRNFPNDSYFSEQWALHNTGQTGGRANADVNAPEAWCIATDCRSIIVAVLDTGVDYTHPDLAANMWVNEAELNGTPGVDDDGNGYVDDIYGYDFSENDSDPMDYHYHGTHVSGTIGAVGNNGLGVSGVCWSARIMALKVFPNYGEVGFINDVIEAMQYAEDKGAKVLSNSWGGGPYSQSLKDAIDNADAAGILFVAAAGNDYGQNNDIYPHYPSSHDCENIIAVLSTDDSDYMSDFSSYGPTSVDIGAPGSGILSCEPGNRYQYLNGTSMAAPHVSGACALIWSVGPGISHLDVKDIILQTVDPVPALAGLCVSNGRLNLYNAISDVTPWIEFIPASGTVAAGDTNDVTLLFNGDQPPGTYHGQVTITSNDSYTPEITIPVTVTIEPVDYFTELFDPNGNDMSNRTLTFRPDVSGSYYNLCSNEALDFPVDPNGGTIISLGDDDYVPVDLNGAHVHFYGTDYDTFYIGSNGYISFISGDIFHIESLTEHFDLPRISALFDDLDPSAGGLVSLKQFDDCVVVTFENVPEYSMSNSNSFQVEMRFGGKIRVTLLDVAAEDGLVGLSDGDGLSAYFNESDLSGYDFCTFECDLNGDQNVDLTDFAIFASYWQMEEGKHAERPGKKPRWSWCEECDFDQSSVIDVYDLLILVERWLE
ncbi:MAG: LamG-like jellyroll fold domain-containing protein [Planctomycetota bacterium]|jgi:hypothetical protein